MFPSFYVSYYRPYFSHLRRNTSSLSFSELKQLRVACVAGAIYGLHRKQVFVCQFRHSREPPKSLIIILVDAAATGVSSPTISRRHSRAIVAA